MAERTQTLAERTRETARSQPTLRLLFSGPHGISASPARQLDAGEVVVLGRTSAEPELSLNDDVGVSRRHATVAVTDIVTLSDAGSHNGTFVNGARVDTRELRDGDVIRVGGSLLVFRHGSASIGDVAVPNVEGRAPAIRAIRALLARAAPTPATIVLLGESGVGKSLLARAIHDQSGREGPFVAVNCGALPETLAESQLFGHVAGAFTGAQVGQPGLFRAADRGTLFLDEVADLPSGVQVKLLHLLEDGAITPVGAVRPIACDVRVIAATNAELSHAIATKRFRGDLYARLSEVTIEVPSLRERREDILPLFARALGDGPRLASAAAEALLLYAWPYNVRELLKLATELKLRWPDVACFEREMLPERFDATAPAPEPATPREEQPAPASDAGPTRSGPPDFEELERLLVQTGGGVSQIARITGRSRKQVYRWLAEHNIDPHRYRR